MTERTDTEQCVCSHCDCAIDRCQMCDEENCPRAVCYSCVIVEIGQEIRQPHPHGG